MDELGNADVTASHLLMLSVSLVPRRPAFTSPFIVYVSGVNDM